MNDTTDKTGNNEHQAGMSSADLLRESLSAFLDNEAGDLEVRRVERELESSGELKAYWSRQQIIRQGLHGQLSGQADIHSDISLSVMSRLESESVPVAENATDAIGQPATTAAARRTNPLAGFAIAASVALAVFLGFQGGQSMNNDSLPPAIIANNPVPSANVHSVSLNSNSSSGVRHEARVSQQALPVSRAVISTEMAAHLQHYYSEHVEQAAHSGSYGLLPYARTAGEF